MPLVRIDLLEGKSEQYRAQVGDILYQTLVDVLNVPEHDRFQVITEHTKASLPFDREYLGIHRSDDCIFFQITLNSGRPTELKNTFYKTLAERLHEGVKTHKEGRLHQRLCGDVRPRIRNAGTYERRNYRPCTPDRTWSCPADTRTHE